MIHTDGCPTIAHRVTDLGPFHVEVYDRDGKFSYTHARHQSLCDAKRIAATLELGGTNARITRSGATLDQDVDTSAWMS